MDNKTADWYQFIEDLVDKYQQGDSKSGMEIITAFEPYLRKYIKIIKDGHIDLKDKDSRRFICLFINDPETRQGLRLRYQSKENRNAAFKAASLLAKSCEMWSIEDMKQDFYVIILTLCKRYKKHGKKTNFCGYLYNVFRYELHRRIMEIMKDPLIFKSNVNISFDDSEYSTYTDECVIEKSLIDDTPIMILEDDLDNSWIRGLTCDDMFLDLTPFHRMILKYYYFDGLSDPKIADKLGMHKNTVYRNRQKAEDSIAEFLGDEFVEALRQRRSIKLNVRNDKE